LLGALLLLLALAENYDEARTRIERVNNRLTPQVAALSAATAPLIERPTSEAPAETASAQAMAEASAPEQAISAEATSETANESMASDESKPPGSQG
jgi:hypothetical protein